MIYFLSYFAAGLKSLGKNHKFGITPSPGEASRFLCGLSFGGELSAVVRGREHRSFSSNSGKTVGK